MNLLRVGRALPARCLTVLLSLIQSVMAADWYVLYAGDLPVYMSSVCRLRWLLITNGVSKDKIITFGNKIKNYPTFDGLPAPDAACEPDFTVKDGVSESFFFNALNQTYDGGVSAPKVLATTNSDNVFMYLAGDTGYDTIRLDGSKNVMHGYDLFQTLMDSGTKFRQMRIFLDGTHFGDTFMKSAISSATTWNSNVAKSIRITASGTGSADATGAQACFCAPQTSVRDAVERFRNLHHLAESHDTDPHYCLSTRFGLTFTSTNTGPTFENHFAAVKNSTTSGEYIAASSSEMEYGIFPENTNGDYFTYCTNSTATSTGAADCNNMYTAFPFTNADSIYTFPNYASGCTKHNNLVSTELLGSYYFDKALRRNDNGALKGELGLRVDAKAKLDSFITSHQCTQVGCLDTTVSLTTAAENACFKDLFAIVQSGTGAPGYSAYTLKTWTLPLANMCKQHSAATLKTDLTALLTSSGGNEAAKATNNADVSFILAIVGFAVSGALYLFFMFFDTRTMEDTEEMQAIKDKEQSRAAGRKLLQEHDRAHGASPL
ncbi:unnamed protein product [Amoebophrya sp. A120]|nr:unnamed protein product [Amoebophrya sp. A120]|eukprot:GSA120T00024109001.1